MSDWLFLTGVAGCDLAQGLHEAGTRKTSMGTPGKSS